MVGTLDGNLCPLGFARVWWFDNFLDNSGESRARFLIHRHFHRARGDQIQFSTNVTHPGQVEPPRRVPLDKSEGEGWWPTQARFWLEWGCSTSQTCSCDKLSSSSCHGDWRGFSRVGRSANYVYDLVGKIKQVTDPTGTYGFAYDNMGRLIGTTTQYSFPPGFNYQNSYTYDAASNRKSLTAPDGSTTSYNYDALNRLSTLTSSLTGQFGFSYDALSRRTQLTRPNGMNTNYSYDSVSRLLSVLHQAGSTTVDGASYTYDYAGNRATKTNYLNNVTEGYTYDLIYQLTQVTQGASTTESYTYDAVGNRLTSLSVPSYNYNASNELTSSSNGSYTYDANGNALSDASGKSYTWDFEHRLLQAVVPGTNGGTTTFNPFGRRIQKSSALG